MEKFVMDDKNKEQEIIKRYGEISKKVLEIDKEDAVKFFREKLSDKYNEKQINAILKTNKPFFL